MGVIDGGSTTPPAITEAAAATTTPTASNSMSEAAAATTTTTAGETITEAPTQRAESHLITYVGAATNTGNNTTAGDFTLPAGWAAGDVAICWWYTRSSSKTFTKPAAVTQLQNASSSYPGRLFVGYRVLVAGDSTFAWTSSSVTNSDIIWGTSVYDGTHSSPIDSESGAPTEWQGYTNPPVPAFSISYDRGRAVAIFGKTDDYSSITAPAYFTLGGSNSSTAGSDASAGAAHSPSYAIGGFGCLPFILGGSSAYGYSYVVSLRPA